MKKPARPRRPTKPTKPTNKHLDNLVPIADSRYELHSPLLQQLIDHFAKKLEIASEDVDFGSIRINYSRAWYVDKIPNPAYPRELEKYDRASAAYPMRLEAYSRRKKLYNVREPVWKAWKLKQAQDSIRNAQEQLKADLKRLEKEFLELEREKGKLLAKAERHHGE